MTIFKYLNFQTLNSATRWVWRNRVLAAALLVVCVFSAEFVLLKLPQAEAAYTIANSARFNDDDSAYLSRTPGSAGNRKTWTLSMWVKRGNLGSTRVPFGARDGSGDQTHIFLTGGNAIRFFSENSAGTRIADLTTVGVFRDPAKWEHIVVVLDASNSTSADRLKIYVDNVRQQVTTTTAVSNTDHFINSMIAHNFGREPAVGGSHYDGYLSDVHFVDGAALAPTCFGEEDSNGYWRPKAYSTGDCAAYGTNGFKLDFANGSDLGNDINGSNDFAENGGLTSATEQVTDTPTNGFATWNPLALTSGTLSNGNLQNTGAGTSTILLSSGKWYWEVKATGAGVSAGVIANSGVVTTSVTSGVIMGFQFDADAGTLATTTDGSSFIGTVSGLTGGRYPYVTGGNTIAIFGAGGTTTLTNNSAAGGYFYFTPPSGYKALSTANLPAPTIAVPKQYFDAYAYTGTGAATSSTHLAFSPGLVWIKNRTDAATSHALFDAVRGVQKWLASNTTGAEDTDDTQSLSAFGTNGFSLGTGASTANVNTSGKNYISWLWKESPTAGMDIVTYSGDNTANRDISHALTVAPDFAIVKRRDSTGDWFVWSSAMSSSSAYALLDTTAATSTTNSPWCTTCAAGNWGASTFRVTNNATNNANASSASYVAYLFKGIDGFSKFGSYTGNGNADGPFVYTGFKPRYLMAKRTDTTGDWFVWDTARDIYNPAVASSTANTAAADGSTTALDVLSNGFKLRATTAALNASGGTYIYAAFAEQPFKYSAASAAAAASSFVQAIAFLMGMTF